MAHEPNPGRAGDPDTVGPPGALPDIGADSATSAALADAAPDALLLVDHDGIIRYANSRCADIIGFDPDELVGHHVEMLVPDGARKRHVAHRTRYRVRPDARSMAEQMDLVALRRDGSQIPVEIALSPVAGDDGSTWTIAAIRDVSEKRARDRDQREIQRLLDATDDVLLVFDADTLDIGYANAGAARQTQYPVAELEAMTPLHICADLDEADLKKLLTPIVDGDTDVVRHRTRFVRRDGETIDVEISIQLPPPVSVDRHDPRRLCVAVARNITDQIAAERRLAETAERFRAAFDAAPFGLAVAGLDGRVVLANGELCRILGRSVGDITTADDPLDLAALLSAGIEGVEHVERRYRRPDGHVAPCVIRVVETVDADGRVEQVLVHVEDLTQRKLAERRIGEAERELSLMADRERIARDLHDTVIQQLFASGMSLQAISAGADPQIAGRLETVIDDLDDAIRDLRTTIFGLRTAPSRSAPLRSQILEVASDAASSLGFHPQLNITGDLDRVGAEQSGEVLAVLREALSNVARHARARAVTIDVRVDDAVTLVVADDGVGIDAGATPGDGLANMARRARGLGGTTTVEGGNGTTVTWVVPATPDPDSSA